MLFPERKVLIRCRVPAGLPLTLQRGRPIKLNRGESEHCERRDLVAVDLPDNQLLHGGCKSL